jgi:hypothetical protein
MKKLFALLFALFALLACQPSNSFTYIVRNAAGHSIKAVPIYLDAAWNKDEVAAIEVAINDWNIALNGQMILIVNDEHYKIGSESDPGLMIIKVSEKNRIACQEDTVIALGWFDRNSKRRIFMVRDRLIARGNGVETEWNMTDVSAVARHEIGHSFDIRHIQYYGLMAPGYDRDEYKCIDQGAAYAVAKAQALNVSEMKWCERITASTSHIR